MKIGLAYYAIYLPNLERSRGIDLPVHSVCGKLRLKELQRLTAGKEPVTAAEREASENTCADG